MVFVQQISSVWGGNSPLGKTMVNLKQTNKHANKQTTNKPCFALFLILFMYFLDAITSKYEDLACTILDECHKNSDKDFRKHDVAKLLFRKLPKFWGGSTCLKLAESTESRRFLAHHSVQSLINEIWRHGLPNEKVMTYFDNVQKINTCRRGTIEPVNHSLWLLTVIVDESIHYYRIVLDTMYNVN